MATVVSRAQIEQVIRPHELVTAVEQAFVAYSRGEAVIPPVGELYFDDPSGDCHIKYGFLRSSTTFTIKIATGFPGNAQRGLATSNGVVLVFSRQTGQLLTIFQDEGYMTDVRTAAAGAVAAKYLAPPKINNIAIIGAGTQARLQLEYLREVTPCRSVRLWARSPDRAREVTVQGFDITVCESPGEAVSGAQLVVTTTASHQWIVGAAAIEPGTHITAVGADGGGKQELDPALFAVAKIRAVDSRIQCAQYGDSAAALSQGLIALDDLVELGELIEQKELRRRNPDDITIADLTGVAVQDIAVADLALMRLAEASQ